MLPHSKYFYSRTLCNATGSLVYDKLSCLWSKIYCEVENIILLFYKTFSDSERIKRLLQQRSKSQSPRWGSICPKRAPLTKSQSPLMYR